MGHKYEPNHYGTVLTFKRGVSEAKIKAALAKLAALCDSPPRIEKFDDRWGGPVWYIP